MSEQDFQPHLRGVVFDLDGLMFNTEELHTDVGCELLARRGLQFTTELKNAMMGRPPRVAFGIMIQWYGLTDTPEQLAVESEEIFEGVLGGRLQTMPGLLELLDALEQAEIPKGIATSSPPSFVERVLTPFQLRPRFQFVLTCDDVINGKPHPEIYQKACRQLNLAPEHVLVLEDSLTGCRAAIDAETFAVAVPGPPTQAFDFSFARMRIDTLADPRLYRLLRIERS